MFKKNTSRATKGGGVKLVLIIFKIYIFAVLYFTEFKRFFTFVGP